MPDEDEITAESPPPVEPNPGVDTEEMERLRQENLALKNQNAKAQVADLLGLSGEDLDTEYEDLGDDPDTRVKMAQKLKTKLEALGEQTKAKTQAQLETENKKTWGENLSPGVGAEPVPPAGSVDEVAANEQGRKIMDQGKGGIKDIMDNPVLKQKREQMVHDLVPNMDMSETA